MADNHPFLNPRTLARLGNVSLRARRIVDGHVAGAHRSPLQGFSVEFAEHREYTPGDDLRHLDWKVYGRTDKFYLKRYEDETNLACHLVVDASESMRFQGADATVNKLHRASCIAATLAWLVLKHQDAVSLTIVDDAVRDVVPVSTSPAHLKAILASLEQAKGLRQTNLKQVLGEVGERLTQRGVVIVISDFLDDPEQVLDALEGLRRRQHDVIAVQVLDRDEIDFPFDRPTRFRGLEQSGMETVDPAALAQVYRRTFADWLAALKRGCTQRQIDYLLCCSDEDFGARLASMLGSR